MNLNQKHIDRFWSRVNVKDPNECWEWAALKDRKGYGLLRANNKNIKAHRISAYLANMPIENKFVCHACDNASCVNPNHLFVGTLQDNVNDYVVKDKAARKLTRQDVLDIRLQYTSLTKNILAEKYNVSGTHIRMIANRQTWRHI